jgi:hypothetical protein
LVFLGDNLIICSILKRLFSASFSKVIGVFRRRTSNVMLAVLPITALIEEEMTAPKQFPRYNFS